MKNSHLSLIVCLASNPQIVFASEGHCYAGEEIYFNCPIKNSNKVASLCGAGFDEVKKIAGYIQYRFGKLGSPELVYPRSTIPNDQRNLFYSWAGISADTSFSESWFVFKNDNWMYKLNYRDERIKGRVVAESSVEIWQGKYGKHMQKHKILKCVRSEGNDGVNLVFKLRLLNSPEFKFDEF